MSAIIDALKIKPFDLEPIYAAWTSPPIFTGISKKDPPVDAWLAEIKAGCIERKVPKEYWHKVAQHNLGPNAKERVNELKLVMSKVHGGKYRWNWKRFKVAMNNMGWDIDPKKTEAIKVATKPSGLWWILGKDKNPSETSVTGTGSDKKPLKESPPSISKPLPPTPQSGRKAPSRKNSVSTSTHAPPESGRKAPSRKNSVSTNAPPESGRKAPSRKNSSTSQSVSTSPNATPDEGGTVTTVQHVPTWLLNACNALDFLTEEHPKVMTTLSAVLITVGSLPAIPALAGGAGGVILASHAAQAAGAIAVGLGNWLKTAQDSARKRELTQTDGVQARIEDSKEA